MKLLSAPANVTGAVLLALGGPDIVSIFSTLGPVLDGLVRLGQFGVAIVTIVYIFKKWKTAGPSRSRRK